MSALHERCIVDIFYMLHLIFFHENVSYLLTHYYKLPYQRTKGK